METCFIEQSFLEAHSFNNPTISPALRKARNLRVAVLLAAPLTLLVLVVVEVLWVEQALA